MLRLRRTPLEPRIELVPLIDVMMFLLTFFVYAQVLTTRVAIVLPPAGEREFGSREMLYTAITRAKESLLLLMPEGPLEERWLRASERKSGLVGRLHG